MRVKLRQKMGISAVFLLLAAAASADSWELRPAAGDAPGSAQIEAGQIDTAIEILSEELESAIGPTRLAVLQNLCVAYAMKREYDTATRYCDRAAAHKEANAETFNNRGVVRAVTGDHRGAKQDFERATCLADCGPDCDSTGIGDVVEQNLQRVLERTAKRDQR